MQKSWKISIPGKEKRRQEGQIKLLGGKGVPILCAATRLMKGLV